MPCCVKISFWFRVQDWTEAQKCMPGRCRRHQLPKSPWYSHFYFWVSRYVSLALDGPAINVKILHAMTIIVSKMTSHCAGTVQMREESESGIRKWEEMWFKTTAEDGERGGSSDVRWKTVPQTSGCDKKRSVADNGQTSTSNVQRRWWGRT